MIERNIDSRIGWGFSIEQRRDRIESNRVEKHWEGKKYGSIWIELRCGTRVPSVRWHGQPDGEEEREKEFMDRGEDSYWSKCGRQTADLINYNRRQRSWIGLLLFATNLRCNSCRPSTSCVERGSNKGWTGWLMRFDTVYRRVALCPRPSFFPFLVTTEFETAISTILTLRFT